MGNDPNPFLGVMLHAIGGLAAACFYIPYKRVRGWSWETYWVIGGIFSWMIAPWAVVVTIVLSFQHPWRSSAMPAGPRCFGPLVRACSGGWEG